MPATKLPPQSSTVSFQCFRMSALESPAVAAHPLWESPAVRFTRRYGSVFPMKHPKGCQNSRKRLFLLLPSMASSFQFLAPDAFPLFLIS
jgi:hypothetical protein